MFSACLIAKANIVKVGLAAAPVVKELPSEINRLKKSWVAPATETTTPAVANLV